MNPERNRSERLEDYLDGLLSPTEQARIERRLADHPEWGRELRSLAAVRSLLDTPLDLDPPADLVPRVLAAVRVRSVRRFRLPAALENGFVLAGALGIAFVVLAFGRSLFADPASWLGRATVAATTAFDAVTEALVGVAGSIAQLDWIARLFATLVQALGTALASSAQPLMTVTLTSLALAAALAWVLHRAERTGRGGGAHVGFLA